MRKSKDYQYIIGIDPGTITGFAIFSKHHIDLIDVDSGSLIYCYEKLIPYKRVCFVRIEDARKRTWYGNAGRGKLQGVGSVKRDCKIWQEICEHHNIPFEMVHPKNNTTKLNAKAFKAITGHEGRTNEHKRDAAMLVYQYNK